MRRVMISGGPGSGKSTLARIMGERTGLPVHHMDHIHWKSGWIMRDRDARKAMALAIENSDSWIFEGGFSTTEAHRASRADTIVFLDLPVGLRFWRVVMRMLRNYGQRRPDLPEGCPERFDRQTLTFWRWIWTTNRKKLRKMPKLFAQYPHLTIHHLQTRSQVAAFIANLPPKQESQP